jgi:hypothetical protein
MRVEFFFFESCGEECLGFSMRMCCLSRRKEENSTTFLLFVSNVYTQEDEIKVRVLDEALPLRDEQVGKFTRNEWNGATYRSCAALETALNHTQLTFRFIAYTV